MSIADIRWKIDNANADDRLGEDRLQMKRTKDGGLTIEVLQMLFSYTTTL